MKTVLFWLHLLAGIVLCVAPLGSISLYLGILAGAAVVVSAEIAHGLLDEFADGHAAMFVVPAPQSKEKP